MKNNDNKEMTIKEAFVHDVVGEITKYSIMMDPAPVHIPILPIVVGKKIVKGAKKFFENI